MSLVAIPEREFNLYAMALPEGPNFNPFVVVSGWKCDNSRGVGGVLLNHDTGDFAIRAFRRRIDHCFTITASESGFKSHEAALAELTARMRPGEEAEPIPPSKKKRRPLLPAKSKEISKAFKLLTESLSHYPALMAAGEIYFAMPNPDDNFVTDFQTENFDSRLFELYLFACFRHGLPRTRVSGLSYRPRRASVRHRGGHRESERETHSGFDRSYFRSRITGGESNWFARRALC